MEQKKKKNKILFISLACVVCVLLLTAIVQTFVLKNKQANLNELTSKKNEINKQIESSKEKHDNIFTNDVGDTEISIDNIKDEYKDEFIKQQIIDSNGNPYGEEGDKVIVVEDEE